ncbi:MAG: chemotaxis protein CheW [Myxococcales bacterium]
MSDEKAAARSKRPSLVFSAGGTRLSVPATAVLEVAEGGLLPGSVHNGLPVEPLAAVLGLPPDAPGGVTLVLDSAPPRAFYVGRVEEVADLASATHLNLPSGAETRAAHLLRGAVLLGERVVLELAPEPLAEFTTLPPAAPPPPPGEGRWDGPPPARALVFTTAGGRLLGVSLQVVIKILAAPQLCRLPYPRHGLAGILAHERTLLPVFDPAELLSGAPAGGAFAIAIDAGGIALGALAHEVKGVVSGFSEGSRPVPGGVEFDAPDGSAVLFPDVERWSGTGR